MKDKFLKALKSRTVWTLVFAFVFNGWMAVSGQFDPQIVLLVNGFLTGLAGYFKLNPSQEY